MRATRPAAAIGHGTAAVEPAVRTLGELLDVAEFGCSVASWTSPDRLGTELAGAHSIDLAQPGAWLEAGWLMLSTCGNLMAGDVVAQRELIAELDGCGVAGLGVGVGVFHDEIPSPLLEEAAARDFPVFEIPHGTPFRDIISSVHRGISNDDSWRANRMITMQAFLVDALVERDPTEVILRRLTALVGMDAGIAGRRGDLLPPGSLPGRLDETRRREIVRVLDRPSSGAMVALEVGGFSGFAVPISEISGSESRWLVLMHGRERSTNPLARPGAQLAVSVLAAVARLDRVQRLREAAGRRAVFDTLLGGRQNHEERLAACQAESAGLRVCDGVAAIAIAARGGRPLPAGLFAELDSAFAQAAIPFVGSMVGGQVRGVLATEETFDALRAIALPLAGDVVIGIGRTVRSVAELHRSLTDATVAARAYVPADREPIVPYEEIDLVTACLHELPLDRLGPKIEATIRDLRSSETVYQTMLCYFEHNLDAVQTAKVLRMHPNTIRHRLAQVEKTIGNSLRDPSTIVALHLAMLLERSADPTAPPSVPRAVRIAS